jgi:hypothetical protein
MKKIFFVFLFLLSVSFYVFSEEYLADKMLIMKSGFTENETYREHYTGKMLIMGWGFTKEDTPLQNNIAIDAILSYAEAAKYQMMWDIDDNPVCQIELYASIFSYIRNYEAVYIYINVKDADNVLDRYIEIDFYANQNNASLLYKLVLNFNNYKWAANADERGQWKLIMEKEPAYDFFVSWVNSLRR